MEAPAATHYRWLGEFDQILEKRTDTRNSIPGGILELVGY